MIEIIAWAGAVLAVIAGLGMLFAPVAPEAARRTRIVGAVFLGIAALNVFFALTL